MINKVFWKKLPNLELGEEGPIEQELDFEDTPEGQERMLSFHMTLAANEGVLIEKGSIKTVRPGDLVGDRITGELSGELSDELVGAEGTGS